jgi:hypothetical protein
MTTSDAEDRVRNEILQAICAGGTKQHATCTVNLNMQRTCNMQHACTMYHTALAERFCPKASCECVLHCLGFTQSKGRDLRVRWFDLHISKQCQSRTHAPCTAARWGWRLRTVSQNAQNLWRSSSACSDCDGQCTVATVRTVRHCGAIVSASQAQANAACRPAVPPEPTGDAAIAE